MKKNFRRILIMFCLAVFVSAAFVNISDAAPPAESPHEEVQAETGTLSGTVQKDGKSALPEHQVVLEIVQDGTLILTIPKKTDAKGVYLFKNIFQQKEFSYAVSTEYEGKMYRTKFVSLKKGEQGRKLDLVVGAGAKAARPLPSPQTGTISEGEDEHVHEMQIPATENFNEYKILALLLSTGAIIWVIVKRKKKK